jgi:peroxiredoxin
MKKRNNENPENRKNFEADEYTIDALNIFPSLLANVYEFSTHSYNEKLIKKFYCKTTTISKEKE